MFSIHSDLESVLDTNDKDFKVARLDSVLPLQVHSQSPLSHNHAYVYVESRSHAYVIR